MVFYKSCSNFYRSHTKPWFYMKLEKEIHQAKFKDPFQKLVVNLIYSGNWVNFNTNKLLKEHKLTPQQFNVLRILKGQHPNPVPIFTITERMLDKMSNASRLVEKLRQKGLVARSECGADRRRVDVVITDEGISKLEEMNDLVATFNHNLSANLSEEEATMLNDLLDKMRGDDEEEKEG